MAFPVGWNRKCQIVVDHTKVVADCADFPVYISEASVPSEMLDADGLHPCQADGGDIRITSDAAGSTRIPMELVYVLTDNDPANGRLEVHTKISISSSIDTSMWIWYNNGGGQVQPARNDAFGSDNVWESHYKGVWHLKDGTVLTLTDSTVNANDGANHGVATATAGKVDGALALAQASSQYIDCGAGASLKITNPVAQEAWVWITAPQQFGRIGSNDNGAGTGSAIFTNRSGTPDTKIAVQAFNGGNQTLYETNNNIGGGAWHHVVGIVDAASATIYVDGTTPAQSHIVGTPGGVAAAVDNFLIGRYAAGAGAYFDGKIDEFRYHSSLRTSSWFYTCFANMNSPGTFAVAQAPEPGYVVTTTAGVSGPSQIKKIAAIIEEQQ